MTDRKINPDPLFAGPAGGTATRLCKRPELARERLELGYLRASGGSRLDGEEWTYRVSAQIEAGPPSRVERMALDLPARAALGFGLDLVEGASIVWRDCTPTQAAEPDPDTCPAWYGWGGAIAPRAVRCPPVMFYPTYGCDGGRG